MKNYLLLLLLLSFLFPQKYNNKLIEKGNREDYYKIWIYFKDKNNSNSIEVSERALERRLRNNVSTKPNWYDLNVSDEYKKEINKLGFQIENESRWLNAVSIKCQKQDLKILSDLSFVKKIEPVLIQKKKFPDISNVLNFNHQIRNYEYGGSEIQMEQINCIEAHNQGYYGQGVRILYIDTGFDLTHEVFDSLNLIYQYDFINDDLNTANENEQEVNDGQDYHGTLCLSVLCGFKEGSLIGPAFKSEFLLAKTEIVAEEIQAEEDNYVAALEWGEENGADISVASLGYYDWYEYEDMDGNTAVTSIAVDIAASLGVLCVNSAGNSGSDEWNYINAPADADSIISVGAVNDQGVIAYFSSKGPTYDGRIKPEVCAMGVSTFCVRSNTISDYRTASGTSLSAPLVGGAAGVVLSANNNWSAMQIRESLMMTALNSDSPDTNYGYGIINVIDAINYEHDLNLIDNNILINDFKILKLYPNPFNPSLNIVLKLSKPSKIRVDIFSINGQYIESIYNGFSNGSNLTLNWDPTKITSGLYFVKVSNSRNHIYKKIMYIK